MHVKKLHGFFSWMGFNFLKAKKSLREGSLLFTNKSSSVWPRMMTG